MDERNVIHGIASGLAAAYTYTDNGLVNTKTDGNGSGDDLRLRWAEPAFHGDAY